MLCGVGRRRVCEKSSLRGVGIGESVLCVSRRGGWFFLMSVLTSLYATVDITG